MLPEVGNKMRILLGLAKVRSEVKIYLNVHSEGLSSTALGERPYEEERERERDLMKRRERETL